MCGCNPLVSVIIPNYCHAKYLEQRIESVLGQTYQNFEVIILDDASPDGGASMVVIEKYRGNPHVSHVEYNDVNSGSTFKQWRKGFELAKGELIWIAESDDYCEKSFLDELVPIWSKYPNSSIVQSGTIRVDGYGNSLENDIVFSGREICETGIECIKNHILCSNFYIPNASAVLFKRDDAINISQDYIKYKSSGDRLFWIYLAEKGDVVKVDKPLNYFRQHNNKVSNAKEYDGTQCRENYQINKYLHSKGYVRNRLRFVEFKFYWNYINKTDFVTENVRKELLELWYGKYYYKSYVFRLCYWLIELQYRIRARLQIRTRLLSVIK